MQVKIEYNLDLPEEDFDMRMLLDGKNWAFAMYDLDQWLRNECKYRDLDVVTYEAYDGLRDKIREILDNYDISLGQIH